MLAHSYSSWPSLVERWFPEILTTVTVLSASHRELEGLGNSVNTVHLLLAAVTKFGDGCFANPALLASLPTEKRAITKPPCDEAAIESGYATVPGTSEAGP
jgi:hypothetical protein